MTDVIDAERAQIGHEIHDALLPLIFAANATVDRIREELPADSTHASRLEQASQWLVQAMQVGRQMLTCIYPPELEQMGWLGAAQDVVRQLAGEGTRVDFAISDAFPGLRPSIDHAEPMPGGQPAASDTTGSASAGNVTQWSKPVAAAAYRIVVEAVRNAIRHGQASQIDVVCGRNSIEITDDGSGFEISDVPTSRFGIRSMRGRAELVGGQLQVESQPGGPTSVRFRFGNNKTE
ncbi:sensor histidine kinase [Stieleria varia]|uniref:Sensor histidine kinase LiaS n=1 Tax=Stieleria varia TaxID=2528005 RepID=A0A5C6B085_9BACT|nr:ATP-binding protein [Stieleria varia]TWU05705.1 Sensor histidine kinase LiaS [Stieleria varia]